MRIRVARDAPQSLSRGRGGSIDEGGGDSNCFGHGGGEGLITRDWRNLI